MKNFEWPVNLGSQVFTIEEIANLGKWVEFCNLRGQDPSSIWRRTMSERITLTEEELTSLNLISKDES